MNNKLFYKAHRNNQEKAWSKDGLLTPGPDNDQHSTINIVSKIIFRLPGIDSLLDIGCGPLVLLNSLKPRIERLYGIDIAEYTCWQKEDKVVTSVADVDEGVPFDNEYLSCVTMLATLEHVFDPFFVVSEVSRILKPGGYFIFSVPNIAGIKHRFNLCLGRLPVTSSKGSWAEREWDGAHLHYFTLGSLKSLLTECGSFSILSVKGSGRFQFLKNIRPSLFSQDLIIVAVKKGL